MQEVFTFIQTHPGFSAVMLILNYFLFSPLVHRVSIYSNRNTLEALGGRINNHSIIHHYSSLLVNSADRWRKHPRIESLYEKAAGRMKKAGYRDRYAVPVYLILKYICPVVFFFALLLACRKGLVSSAIYSAAIYIIVEMVVLSASRKLNMKFQRNAYRIYKYLSNQISSGVKPYDAIKTVYQIIDDLDIRRILLQLAANYELTSDINYALEDFRTNFDSPEADTLCVALKQGIATGDNQGLLEKQERVMFSKYFNYIQAETDRCRWQSFFAAAMFTLIIVIMILIPLLNQMTEGMNKIFIY